METVQLPYGKKDGKLVHVDDVPNGRACGCVCPACGSPLEARNAGKIKQSYFAHYDAVECNHGVETAVHLMAKQVLHEIKTVVLPEYNKTPTVSDLEGQPYTGTNIYRAGEALALDEVVLEKGDAGFRADAVGKYSDNIIYIEIKVSHEVDYKKASLVRSRKGRMIEIDLSELDAQSIFNKEAFINEVTSNPDNRIWISHPEADGEYQNQLKALREKIRPINEEIRARRKEERAKQKEEIAYRDSFDRNKARFREPHLADLEKLEKIHDPDWQRMRLVELETSSHSLLPELFRNLNLNEVPDFLNISIKSEWIFNVYRKVWQTGIFLKFIFQKPEETVLQANEVKKWVVQKYGILDFIERLNNAKQAGKRQGKERRQWYGEEGAWFLSSHENRSIISPYKPIIDYLDTLRKLGILRAGNEKGQFLIGLNTPEGIMQYLEKVRADRIRRDELISMALQCKQDNEKRYLENPKALSAERIEQLLLSEERVVKLFDIRARRCLICLFTSHAQDGEECPFCLGVNFENHLLSASYLESAIHRYRSSPRVATSIKLIPFPNISILNVED